MKRKILCAFIGLYTLFFSWELPAQIQFLNQNKTYNFTSFSKIPKEVNIELTQLTPENFQTHPEFGTLQYGAPCTDSYE